ncbi:putative protein kinase RLK-Pelle-LRR-XII-1 family [Helianthus annuus]|nr:putative protein kinase RLK-Pelle-LRR-XII-1 family [Helianthus annuus]
MDVASALDYIHNHCIPSIVHGDLKPSNILLDDDMVAHIGDFGLADFLELHTHTAQPGLEEQLYGLGNEMTSSGDVCSFGILLLNVMTEKNRLRTSLLKALPFTNLLPWPCQTM